MRTVPFIHFQIKKRIAMSGKMRNFAAEKINRSRKILLLTFIQYYPFMHLFQSL